MSDPNRQTAQPQGERRYQALRGVDAEQVNDFIRGRTLLTAREWAVAGLIPDHRSRTGIEMSDLGERASEVVPWIDEPISGAAVGVTRSRVESKVRRATATVLWALYSGTFTEDEVDKLMYDGTEIARFMLALEGNRLAFEDEQAAERRLADAARRVRDDA